jgi:hypothetical protein
MKTTVEQVRAAMLKMNQDCTREINDGSGESGTFTLRDTILTDGSFCICNNINQWINEQYDSTDDTHDWTEQDIIDYVNETYPEA